MQGLKYFEGPAQEDPSRLGELKSLSQAAATWNDGDFLSQERPLREAGQEAIDRKEIQRKRALTAPRFGSALSNSIVTVERTE
jgi:hypothetical protein